MVLVTMKFTGADMSKISKETSLAGAALYLCVNGVER
jgi:hypothetical protein